MLNSFLEYARLDGAPGPVPAEPFDLVEVISGIVALTASSVNYLSGEPPGSPTPIIAVLRYRGQELPATLVPTGPTTARVEFAEVPRSVAPGQAVVFYAADDRERVLGGGTVEGTVRV